MKKIKKQTKKIPEILIISLVIVFSIISFAQVQAQETGEVKLTPDFAVTPSSPESKLVLVSNLPSDSWQVVLSGVIQLILGITGSLAFIAFTVGGIMMVTSQGNEERITKGKTIILYSVLALIIIATSYAIVLGITQLNLIP